MQGHRLAPMAFAYYGVNHNITATTANIAAMFACPFLYIYAKRNAQSFLLESFF
jgi:hypothetical protein